VLHTIGWKREASRDCRLGLSDGAAYEVVGVVRAAPVKGRAWLRIEEGLGTECRPEVRLTLPLTRGAASAAELPPRSDSTLAAAQRVRIQGTWRRLDPNPAWPEYAGDLFVRSVEPLGEADGEWAVRRRASVEAAFERLFPERHALVSALLLARMEGLDAELKTAFSRAGTVHILSISGFHVGVIATLLIALLRALGIAARPAALFASVGVWAYVLFIGAPDAAARAAFILTLMAVGGFRGRPLSQIGTLATSFLALVVWDPGAVTRVGFQLSFLGVVGLVLLARPLEALLRPALPGTALRPFRAALAAGAGATLCTLPCVAWHFGQLSVVGVPATLVSSPLVAAAIPGSFAALALDLVHPALGRFIAGGTDVFLVLLMRATRWLGGLEWAVASTPRAWVIPGLVGSVTGWVLVLGTERVRTPVRGVIAAAGAISALILLPLSDRIASRGALGVYFLDVGQGDAILLRSPRGRWVMVDAGPPAPRGRMEPAAMVALRSLRVPSLEMLVLTHAHLDHIGGASTVLRSVEVGAVVDPGMARGSDVFVSLLETASELGRGWRGAKEGDSWNVDGVELTVLHSLDSTPASSGGDVVNENSVVLLVRFGEFSMLLTGDAPTEVEDDATRGIGEVDVLKVGHHGSRTSTTPELLRSLRPSLAVISVGRGNRYRHPHLPVLEALEAAVPEVLRTDSRGTVRLTAQRNGGYSVAAARAP
jgi:competence protein ComEC